MKKKATSPKKKSKANKKNAAGKKRRVSASSRLLKSKKTVSAGKKKRVSKAPVKKAGVKVKAKNISSAQSPGKKTATAKKKKPPKQTPSPRAGNAGKKSAQAKRKSSVLRRLARMEVRLFEEHYDGAEVLLETVREIKSQEPLAKGQKNEIGIHFSPDRASPHVLDLKGDEISPPSLDKGAGHARGTWKNFEENFSHGTGPYRAGEGSSALWGKVYALSLVSWSIYVAWLLKRVFSPAARVGFRVARFLAVSFFSHLKQLKHVSKLFVQSLFNKEVPQSDAFLYPEFASFNFSLFKNSETEKERGWYLHLQPAVVKSVVIFLGLSLVVVLPIKAMTVYQNLDVQRARVLGASETAYSTLQKALGEVKDLSFTSAQEHFLVSQELFSSVYQDLESMPRATKFVLSLSPPTKKKMRSAEALLQVGIDISSLGEQLSRFFELLHTPESTITLTQKISLLNSQVKNVTLVSERIQQNLAQVSPDALPDDVRKEIGYWQDMLPKLQNQFNHVADILSFAYDFLGGDRQQQYLVIFQNSDELRPTGGFMGSLSFVRLYQGKVIETKTPGGGPYDFQGQLTMRVQAPEPLLIVGDSWQLQDANWFFDFPTSAQKLLWFYAQAGTEQLDGVIAINSYVLPKVLQLVGDIPLPAYGKYFTPDNVLQEIQKAVELEYDREENKPKKIIGDLLSAILERIEQFDQKQLASLLELFGSALRQKEVQVYMVDQPLQERVRALQWSGSVVQNKGDYVAVVNTNISGGKTDKYIQQKVNITSEIGPQGDILNEVVIQRTNFGIAGDPFYGYNNVDYIRVYVPQGAQLLEAGGDFEIPQDKFFQTPDPEAMPDKLLTQVERDIGRDAASGTRVYEAFGKTVFANWLQTNIGETNKIYFRYKLPFALQSIKTRSDLRLVKWFDQLLADMGLGQEKSDKAWHSFYFQKQPGQHQSTVTYTVRKPSEWNLEYMAKPAFAQGDEILYTFDSEQDFSTGFLFGTE